MLGTLADAVHRASCRLQHLASPCVDLAADQKWNQDLGVVAKVVLARRHVVLVAAVAVASAIGVVLEQIDVAFDAFFTKAFFGRGE